MAGSGDLVPQWLVRRASSDAFFLGKALAEYQAIYGIDDRKLAEMLECTPDALARLALCRRLADQGARFREDVQRIAAFALCNAEGLAQILRAVAAFASLRENLSERSRGLLMAARDRRGKEGPQRKRPADKREPEE